MLRHTLSAGLLVLFLTPLSAFAVIPLPLESQASSNLLPSPFPVYTNGSIVINHSVPGFEQKFLPTNNDFKDNPGCYIGCYSHDKENGIYPVGNNIFVNGQIRVSGSYQARICIPTGYENKPISGEATFKTLCATKIPSCKNNQCWGGGDTGGWFGIQ